MPQPPAPVHLSPNARRVPRRPRARSRLDRHCDRRRSRRVPSSLLLDPRDSRWALDILADEGFRYDTSVFPVRNDRYGIPDAQREPFDIATPSGPLHEIPLTPVRIAGANVPFSGGAYLRILPAVAQRLAWKLAERQGMRVVAYIHPWELDPEHPRIPLRRRVAATHYARLGVTERRLGDLFRDHRFGRLDDVFAVA